MTRPFSRADAKKRAESELMYARMDYAFWCRQDGRLTQDERAQKSAALMRVQRLERIGRGEEP